MMREFAGISAYAEEVNVEEHFEEWYNDDGMLYLVSKKEYEHGEHGEDDLNFKYKYVIRVMDIANFSGDEEAPIAIELLLVPSPESLCEEVRESVKDSTGNEEIDYYDVSEYGISVRMGDDYIEGIEGDRYYLDEIEAVREKIEAVVAVYEAVDSMRGFYLDRAWNMVGTTGWDTLNNAIKNEPLFKF